MSLMDGKLAEHILSNHNPHWKKETKVQLYDILDSYIQNGFKFTSIVIEFGVRFLKTKPKFLAAETSAASSGD